MNGIDTLIGHVDTVVRTCAGTPAAPDRPSPAAGFNHTSPERRNTTAQSAGTAPDVHDADRDLAMRLMRVNHAGEVSAQALYHGQALTARSAEVRAAMHDSAREEADHLAWCAERIDELGGQVSVLNPVWYAGSFGIGALAGLFGDRVSLGFIAETERQVVAHLERHLDRLPEHDAKSRAILAQMRADEAHHAESAQDLGGVPLPRPVQGLMGVVSKVMTRTAFWL